MAWKAPARSTFATDRMVIWTKGNAQPDLDGQTLQGNETPLEIYMEGNIVFRQGERVIHAQRMYYDVNNQVGTVLQANILTPVAVTAGCCVCGPTSCSRPAPTGFSPTTRLSPAAAWKIRAIGCRPRMCTSRTSNDP